MNSPTRIFFFGTPAIAVPSLEALAADPNVEVVGVGVFPDRPVGRQQVLSPCAVKVAAEQLHLSVFEIDSKQALLDVFATQTFDLGIVIAFGRIFPEEVLSVPPLGVINVHFSLLPQYRGASPVQAAILSGDTESGITWQRMVRALDAGDVLYQVPHNTTNKSTATLWSEMAQKTAESFPQFVQDYAHGVLIETPQNESLATFCGKLERQDGAVDPTTETATQIYRKYLAFDPWPGIFFASEKGRLKILSCHLEPNSDTIPFSCAGNTTLHLDIVQLAGKQPQSAKTLTLFT